MSEPKPTFRDIPYEVYYTLHKQMDPITARKLAATSKDQQDKYLVTRKISDECKKMSTSELYRFLEHKLQPIFNGNQNTIPEDIMKCGKILLVRYFSKNQNNKNVPTELYKKKYYVLLYFLMILDQYFSGYFSKKRYDLRRAQELIYYDFEAVFLLACQDGNLFWVKELIGYTHSTTRFRGNEQALIYGHLEVIKYLYRYRRDPKSHNPDKYLEMAFETKNTELVKIFLNEPALNICYGDGKILSAACEFGTIQQVNKILEIIAEQNCTNIKYGIILAAAAKSGNSEIFNRIYTIPNVHPDAMTLSNAILAGNENIIDKLFYHVEIDYSSDLIVSAISQTKKMNLLKKVLDKVKPIPGKYTEYMDIFLWELLRKNFLDGFKYIIETYHPINTTWQAGKYINYMILHRRPDFLEYSMTQKYFSLNDDYFKLAIHFGYLEIVRILLKDIRFSVLMDPITIRLYRQLKWVVKNYELGNFRTRESLMTLEQYQLRLLAGYLNIEGSTTGSMDHLLEKILEKNAG